MIYRLLYITLFTFCFSQFSYSTIGTGRTENYKGYVLSVFIQTGCATTKDYPTEEAENYALNEISRLFNDHAGEVQKAFTHYLHGDHPFKSYRNLLLESKKETSLTMKYFRFLGFNLVLKIKENIPHSIQEKIRYDFILSQGFKGGVFYNKPLKQAWNFTLSQHKYDLETPLRIALSKLKNNEPPVEFHLPEKIDINNHIELNTLRQSFKVRVLLSVLDEKPYGEDFFTSLKILPKPYYFDILNFAVLCLSGHNKEDKARILNFAKRYKVNNPIGGMPLTTTYEELLK